MSDEAAVQLEARDACAKLCRRHRLELVSLRPAAAGGSVYTAHVRDQAGKDLLLKQSVGLQGPLEATALRAWSETGAAARLVEELEQGAYLSEWLDGVTLADMEPSEPADAPALGRMVHALHSVPVPAGIPDVRERLPRTLGAAWEVLTAELRPLAADVLACIRRLDGSQPVLLHGDLVPSNVMLTSTGPRVVDPNPGAGLAAWDVAQLWVSTAGRGRQLATRQLLDGYGSEPPLLAEMLAWMLLWFLQRNLAAGRSQFSRNLEPFAAELAGAGSPKAFLSRQMAG